MNLPFNAGKKLHLLTNKKNNDIIKWLLKYDKLKEEYPLSPKGT